MTSENSGRDRSARADAPSPFARFRRWFADRSSRARTLLIAGAGALAIGIAGAMGTDVWGLMKTFFAKTPADAEMAANTYEGERPPHEMSEKEKRAMFAKLYPGAEYDGAILPSEDGKFETIGEALANLKGEWQSGYRIPINRRPTMIHLRFTPATVMTGEVMLPNCSARFSMYRADNLDTITFKKQSDTGRSPCSEMVALQMMVPSGTIASMALPMRDGSTTGQGPVNKTFAP